MMSLVDISVGSGPSSPIQRQPASTTQASPQQSQLAKCASLSSLPTLQGSILGQSPGTPVKVNIRPDDWAQPSTAFIEMGEPQPTRQMPETLEMSSVSPETVQLTQDAPLEYLQVDGISCRAIGASPEPPDLTQGQQPLPETAGEGFEAARDLQSLNSNPEGPRASTETGGSIKILPSNQECIRHSRETDTSSSTPSWSNPLASTGASVVTSGSSVSMIENEGRKSEDTSVGDSIPEDAVEPVPRLHYHHLPLPSEPATCEKQQSKRAVSTPDLLENGTPPDRRLTPVSNVRRSSMPRPQSLLSVYSDRGRASVHYGKAGTRALSSNSARRSPDSRPSYAELLNLPYPQPAPAPLTIDNSQLRNVVGSNASLLSSQRTLEMYRQNVKKTNDHSLQYSFAVCLISTAQEKGLDVRGSRSKALLKSPSPRDGSPGDDMGSDPLELVNEARAILQKLANAGYPFAQYYLADGYASGLFSKGKEDYNAAFPLFVLAAKHGHAESTYRAALCYEFGWGTKRDLSRAFQFLRTASSKRHPGAMARLGKGCLFGEFGEKRYREGLKWLKLATESADAMYNSAPYQLGCLYETGYGDDIFKDEVYAAELLTQAAELGHAEANYRMGDAYEHGKLLCPQDPSLSVHFYAAAAERGHPAAMMGLCAWYLVGAEPILERDEGEACHWARRSAELGYIKALFALGYFTEMGIGCRRNMLEANVWYVKAAEAGDERATQRLNNIQAAASGGKPMAVAPPKANDLRRRSGVKDENCMVM